jgi:hypothetical protein
MKFIIIKSPCQIASHKGDGDQFFVVKEFSVTAKTNITPVEADDLESLELANGLTKVVSKVDKIPRSISSWKAKAVLSATAHGSGTLYSAVEEAITAMPDGLEKTTLQAAWQFNADLARNSNAVTQLSSILGLTKEQVDELFIQASKLTV